MGIVADYAIQDIRGVRPVARCTRNLRRMEQHRGGLFGRVSFRFEICWIILIALVYRDDNQVLSWSVSTNQATKVAQLDKEVFATDMQFLPRVSGTLGKHGDLILITCADGRFHIMNRAGRIERTVEAHKGAITVGQWGNDGTGLLTGKWSCFVTILIY